MSFPGPTESQGRIVWASLTAFAIALLIAIVCAFIWGLGQVLHVLSPVLWPLAIAGVIAYLLDPLVDFFERRKVPRQRAIVLVFIIAATIVLGIGVSIVPRLVFDARELASRVPAIGLNFEDGGTR